MEFQVIYVGKGRITHISLKDSNHIQEISAQRSAELLHQIYNELQGEKFIVGETYLIPLAYLAIYDMAKAESLCESMLATGFQLLGIQGVCKDLTTMGYPILEEVEALSTILDTDVVRQLVASIEMEKATSAFLTEEALDVMANNVLYTMTEMSTPLMYAYNNETSDYICNSQGCKIKFCAERDVILQIRDRLQLPYQEAESYYRTNIVLEEVND